MAEKSGFFDAHLVNGEYDRVYLAENFAKYFASFIGNGIFGGKSSELMVQQKATADMSVKVLSGQGWINGYWYENDNELSLAIDVADGVLNRIDIVVLRWDNSERVIRLDVKKGTPATNASAPIIQRNADMYELMLAHVYVKAGATKITQADIVDTRLNNDVCGFVHGVVEQFDTTVFGKQIDSFIENFEASSIAKMQAIFDALNDAIDENAVANLIIDINNTLSETILAAQTLGYSKKNLIPYPYRETTKTINGVTFTDNGDGTITANGTPTSSATVAIFQLSNIRLDASKKYLLTDGTNANQDTYYTQLYAANATRLPASSVNGPVEFTPEENVTYTVRLVIKTTVSNLVFKPMIRRAEISDNNWEPYKSSVAEMIQEDENDIGCFYRINKLTGKKEWLNPTSAPGLEYPLVERWNNEPVYQMTLYAASLPNNSIMVLEMNASWDRIISVSGYALDSDDLTSYPFPVTLHNQVTPIAVISRVEGDGSLVITTNGDASYLEAYITIKYTKSY